MIEKNIFINGLGGDCPGKAEIEKARVEAATVVVEYLPQSRVEGEIQQLPENFVCTELHEIIKQDKVLNVEQDGTILYDSLGFALEDYSLLRLFYTRAKNNQVGSEMNLIPELANVKNLFSLLEITTQCFVQKKQFFK